MEVRYPPQPKKGYLSDTCAIPFENKANGCDTPLFDTISKGYCAIWGGISHWATKLARQNDYRQEKSKGNGGATTKGNDQSRPRKKKKKPRASKRTSRRILLWEFLEKKKPLRGSGVAPPLFFKEKSFSKYFRGLYRKIL